MVLGEDSALRGADRGDGQTMVTASPANTAVTRVRVTPLSNTATASTRAFGAVLGPQGLGETAPCRGVKRLRLLPPGQRFWASASGQM